MSAGFGAAATLFRENGDTIRNQTQKARDTFADCLKTKLGANLILNGPPLGERHNGNLNIALNVPSDQLLLKLASNISASNGSACSSGSYSGSHVLRAIGAKEYEEQSLRFGFGIPLNEHDIQIAASHFLSSLNSE